MARRSVPPPKPKSPTLTAGQRRRRIERSQALRLHLIDKARPSDVTAARRRPPGSAAPQAVRQEVGASTHFVARTVEVVADRFASAAEMAPDS